MVLSVHAHPLLKNKCIFSNKKLFEAKEFFLRLQRANFSNPTENVITVERILLTYLRTRLKGSFLTYNLTYHKFPFADKLWPLEKNKGHFIVLELNSGIIKWPYFLPEVFSL